MVGMVVTAGVLLGVAIGTVGLAAASGSRVASPRAAHDTSSSAPCTSASYTLTVDVTPPTGTALSISVTGQVDFVSEAVTASVTLPSSFPIAALAGTTLKAELVAGTVYVAVPASLSGFVGGAPWVSIAVPSTAATGLGTVFTDLASWCGNAQSIVSALDSHGGSTASLGSSSIDDVPATGTQVEQVGKRIPRMLKLPRSLTRGIFEGGKAPIDVWADPQGQLVRLTIGGTVTLTVTNIDQPVSITAPTGAVPLPQSFLKMFGSL
jgi:hypothetical protein